jgi:hypothetical protein
MYVLDDGCAFEQEIMERGCDNPLFNFLGAYILCLAAFQRRWTEPFIMITRSGRWISPPSSQHTRENEQYIMLKENKLLAWQGEPIILTQIKDEYQQVVKYYGEEGKSYINWEATWHYH